MPLVCSRFLVSCSTQLQRTRQLLICSYRLTVRLNIRSISVVPTDTMAKWTEKAINEHTLHLLIFE